jgi:L-amino acid N-acyltransferase YncA
MGLIGRRTASLKLVRTAEVVRVRAGTAAFRQDYHGAVLIRGATVADAEACARVYAPYVDGSCISFEYEAPSAADLAGRMAAAHAWVVAEEDGDVVGYAYASPHKARAAYRWTADVAIYTDARRQGRGLGRRLYEELLGLLPGLGLRVLVAVVAQPNPSSDALHRSLGFEEIGVHRGIGWKDGRWHDVRLWQLRIGDDGAPPANLQA